MSEHTEIILIEFEIGVSKMVSATELCIPPDSQVPTLFIEVLEPHSSTFFLFEIILIIIWLNKEYKQCFQN